MTLAQFAIAVGAGTKWVQNAAAALGRPLAYTEEEARRLGLARVLQSVAGMPLQRAWELACEALASPSKHTVLAESADGSVQVSVDVRRYLFTFTALLRQASAHEPRRRGRPSVNRWTAESYGLDISQIDANLRRPLAERLREADDAAELMNRFRSGNR
jgi:hypothetical protein